MPRYDIDFSLELKGIGRLHCGTGAGRSWADRTTRLDPSGRAVVPASHLKGVVRDTFERLHTQMGGSPPDPHEQEGDWSSTIEAAVFGGPGEGDIRCVFPDLVSDSSVFTEGDHGMVMKRVRMDRRLGRAADKALFDTEYAVLSAPLTGRITLWLDPTDDALRRKALALLIGALRLTNAVGGDRSTGAGIADVSVNGVFEDGDEIQLAEVLSAFGDEKLWPENREEQR